MGGKRMTSYFTENWNHLLRSWEVGFVRKPHAQFSLASFLPSSHRSARLPSVFVLPAHSSLLSAFFVGVPSLTPEAQSSLSLSFFFHFASFPPLLSPNLLPHVVFADRLNELRLWLWETVQSFKPEIYFTWSINCLNFPHSPTALGYEALAI